MNVLLFSGGLDSTALAHWLRPAELFFIDYGQISAVGELRAARQIAKDLNLSLRVETMNCRSLGVGDMAASEPLSEAAPEFWPYRNQLLITLAAMAYAAEDSLTVSIGTVKSDAIHPDGRPQFFGAMQSLLAVQGNAQVDFPAKHMTSADLLKQAAVPTSILGWTFSCHRAEIACGQCRGCLKHFATLSAFG